MSGMYSTNTSCSCNFLHSSVCTASVRVSLLLYTRCLVGALVGKENVGVRSNIGFFVMEGKTKNEMRCLRDKAKVGKAEKATNDARRRGEENKRGLYLHKCQTHAPKSLTSVMHPTMRSKSRLLSSSRNRPVLPITQIKI